MPQQQSPLPFILDMAKQIFGLRDEELDSDLSILELGLDSLMIIKLGQEIERNFGVVLETQWFLTTLPSLRTLANHVDARRPEQQKQSQKLQTPQLQTEHPGDSCTNKPENAQNKPTEQAQTQRTLSSPVTVQPDALSPLFAIQLAAMQELFATQLQAFTRTSSNGTAEDNIPATPPTCLSKHLPADRQTTATEQTSVFENAGSPAPLAAQSVPSNTATAAKKPHLRGFVLEPTPLTAQQSEFVQRCVQSHLARTPNSRELGRRSPVLADWKSTLSYRPELSKIAYPIVAQSTQGGRFTDVDGCNYLDIALGMGVHFLGHTPSYVTEAIRRRIDRGFGLGPQCDLTAEAAQRIARLTGSERVSFCNTGSEAVMFALRLARAKTGKQTIALFKGAYHGTFDGILGVEGESTPLTQSDLGKQNNAASGLLSRPNGMDSVAPGSPGTPPGMVQDLLLLDYNAESAFALLEQHADTLAAVLVEPVQSRRPGLQPQHFLRRLRRFTQQRGICLIFDEMVTGFRIAPGGAQEYFGIRADMALYGKIVGGGLPVGVISGKKEYLDYIDGGFLGADNQLASSETIVFGGTFCRHPLSMEAVCATTGHLLEQGPALQKAVNARATALADRLNFWFQTNEVPLRFMHFASQFIFESYGAYSAFAQPVELPLFYMLLLERGIYTWERRTCCLSTEHTQEELDHLELAVKDSVLALRQGGFSFRSNIGAPVFFTPMSPTQERLYAIFQRPHGQDAYHLPLAWKIEGNLDVDHLEISLGECIKRHEALRTSFHQIDGHLLQKILPEPSFHVERRNCRTEQHSTPPSPEALLHEFVRPFDLEVAPLLRAAVVRLDENSHLFMLDILHITADGASLGILLDELNALMQGQPLTSRPTQFREVQNLENPLAVQSDTAYWSQQLASIPPLTLPLDFPERTGSPKGSQHWMVVDTPLLTAAKQACRTYGITLNMLLHGVYVLLLHTLTGAERFCVGMADGGRFTEEAATAMGMFVNTVPLDFSLHKEQPITEFFAEIRTSCAQSMARNHAPYGDLVLALGFSPATTMLSYERADHRRPNWPGLKIAALSPPSQGAMYDFSMDIVEIDNQLHCNLLHSEALTQASAKTYGELFLHLLEQAAAQTTTTVTALSVLPPQCRELLRRLHQNRPAQAPHHSTRKHADDDPAPETDNKASSIEGNAETLTLFGNASSSEIRTANPASTLTSSTSPATAGYEPPQTPQEQALAEVWAEQLRVKRVGRNDNFFALGGDSIKALMITARIRTKGYSLRAGEFFQDATLHALALHLEPLAGYSTSMKEGTTPPAPHKANLLSTPSTELSISIPASSPASASTMSPLSASVFSPSSAPTDSPISAPIATPAILPAATFSPETDKARILERYGNRVEHIHNLAPLQEGLLFHHQLNTSSPAYTEQTLLHISGPLNAEHLHLRLKESMARHEGLRSALAYTRLTRPQVVVLHPDALPQNFFACHDLTATTPQAQKKRITADAAALLQSGFTLEEPPLVRLFLYTLAPNEHALLFTIHHAIADGWSTGILFSELFRQDNSPLPPALPYRTYVSWLEAQNHKAQRQWWQKYLEGVEEQTEIPGEILLGENNPESIHPEEFQADSSPITRTEATAYHNEQIRFPLSFEQSGALRSIGIQRKVTLNTILQAAWGVVLSRCNRHDNLVFGEVVSGRPAELPGVETLFGLCSNMIPVHIRYRAQERFSDLLRTVQENALAARDYAFYPLAEIQKDSALGRNLLSHFFVMENYPQPEGGEHLQIRITDSFSQTNFNFAVVWEQGGQTPDALQGSFIFNAASYPVWQMESLKKAYLTVLNTICHNPDIPLADIRLSPEGSLLLEESTPPAVPYPPATVVELFQQTVQRQPDSTALVFGKTRLSYAELDHKSTLLAHALRKAGAEKERIVAICLNRGTGYAIAALAALKAGAAFLPLAPDSPPDRLRYQLEDARPAALISEAAVLVKDSPLYLAQGKPAFAGQSELTHSESTRLFYAAHGDIPLFDVYAPVSAVNSSLELPTLSGLAYVIYTSGTTGQPKGVLTEHASLTNQSLWTCRHYGLHKKSVLTQFAAHAFDVSLWELFPGLLVGAELHVLDEPLRRNLDALAQYLRQNKVTDLWLPPQAAEVFLREYSTKGLTSLTAGGDVFISPHIREAEPHFFLYNNYGPTECCITATSHKFRPGHTPVTIGTPVDNTQAYILDRHGHLQPHGFAGELYIGGIQVARGYLNQPQLTAAAFLPNPFTASTAPETSRIYRTGDLCRRLADGNIAYLGRVDRQVKIRGHRIELAEIEKKLLTHPAVRQCVVLARTEAGGSKRLCAYLVTHSGQPLSSADLRNFAAAWLPAYMVPPDYLFLESLPLTVTGKVDKTRLPAPESEQTSFVPPVTEQEKVLATVLAEVLRAPQVSLHDDFFSLGGDSIKAMQVLSRLALLGYELNMKTLYGQADVKELAQALAPAPEATESATPLYGEHLLNWHEFPQLPCLHDEIEHIRPLSPMQEAMLFSQEHEPHHHPYLIHNWAELHGDLDPTELERRLQQLAQRHEALRTAFIIPGEQPHSTAAARPCQVVLRHRPAPFQYEDITALGEAEQKTHLHSVEASLRAAPLDLAHTPLFRLFLFRVGSKPESAQFTLLISWHHAILDGWSLALLTQELFFDSEQPPVPFRAWLDWQAAQNHDGSHSHWWREQLAELTATTALPLHIHSSKVELNNEHNGTLSFRLDKHTDRTLRTLATTRRLTLNSLLQTAWGAVLSRYSCNNEVLFGTVVSGRPARLPGAEHVVGLCVNTVPVRLFYPTEATFIQAAKRAQEVLLAAAEHPCCSVAELRALAGSAFTDIVFVMENQPSTPEAQEGKNLTIRPLHSSGYTGIPFVVEWTDTGRLACSFHYGTHLEAWQAEALRDHYLTLLEQMSLRPDVPWRELPMLTPAEERRILLHAEGESTSLSTIPAHNIATEEDTEPTILDLFKQCRENGPERIAVADEHTTYSYAQLDEHCRNLATGLNARGLGRGDIVGVLLPRSADFVLAALGVMMSGAAYLPLDPATPAQRLLFMIADAGIQLVIGTHDSATDDYSTVQQELLPSLSQGLHSIQELSELAKSTTSFDSALPAEQNFSPVLPSDLAYVIYTSGSTGKPKGVLLEHRGLANLCQWQHASFPAGPNDIYSAYAPIIFDASVYEIFPALTCGATVRIVPESIRTDAEALARFFQSQRISIAFLPPLVGKEMLRANEITPIKHTFNPQSARSNTHSLTHLRVLTLAGDKPGSLAPQHFTLLNCYGPTEFTVCATAFAVREVQQLPPIGRPISNTRCYVLDSHGHLQPYGIPGELCISGVQLARGYVNRPEQTAAAFVPNPLSKGHPTYARMYRTGDICRLMPDGNLEFLGRKDEQLKIRGQRIEPGEIEQLLREHPAVEEAIIIPAKNTKIPERHSLPSSETSGANNDTAISGLYAYIVLRKNTEATADSLTQWLAQRLPHWMLPSYLHLLSALPLTENGKVDKKALPAPTARSCGSSPVTALEKLLAEIWCDVLNIPLPGVDDSFFSLGGDSIKAMQVVSRIRAAGFPITTRQLFRYNTIATLAHSLQTIPTASPALTLNALPVNAPTAIPDTAPATTALPGYGENASCLQSVAPQSSSSNKADLAPSPAEWQIITELLATHEKNYATDTCIADIYPLTPMQEGILFHSTLKAESALYIEQSRLDLFDSLEPETLRHRLQEVIARHPVLRTVFAWKGLSRPWQIVLQKTPCPLTVKNLCHLSPDDQNAHVQTLLRETREQGLPLETGPLLHLTLCLLNEKQCCLLLSFHHIILDGWSVGLLAKELLENSLPASNDAPPFKKYVEWILQTPSETSQAYWRRSLAEVKATDIPGIGSASHLPYKSESLRLPLSNTLVQGLYNLAARCGVTMNILLQTAWGLVLARCNNTDECVFGAVLSGRNAPVSGLERMIGLFVNTVPVRIAYPAGQPFSQILPVVQAATLDAEEHAHLPLADIQKNTPLGTALIQHLFVMENLPDFSGKSRENAAGQSKAKHAPDAQDEQQQGFNATNYDLSMVLESNAEKKLNGKIQYNASALSLRTVEALANQFTTLLGHIIAAPDIPVDSLTITNKDAEQSLLQAALPVVSSYDSTRTVLDLFLESAAQHPQKQAVVCGEDSFTYAALNEQSSLLARTLQKQGCGPEAIIGILLPRCSQQIVAMLGILKAGAAYLHLDPQYPEARITYMLEHAAPQALITNAALQGMVRNYTGHTLILEAPLSPIADTDSIEAVPNMLRPQPHHLAYVVYTSGTTGRPKGVAIEHRSLAHFSMWHKDFYGITEADTAGHVFSFSFDASAWGIFPILAAGGCIHILCGEDRSNPSRLQEYFDRHNITVANIPTALCELFCNLPAPRRLRILTTGGDTLRSWHPLPYSVYNEYGPCEATVMVSCHKVQAKGNIPIGTPIADMQCLILDKHGLLQPKGYPGELYISGIQLGRGYLHDPEATAAAFISNPYAPSEKPEFARMYRTGDICRFSTATPEGYLEFLGRLDDQVSIRGHRIELTEIERVLTEHPDIHAAVVIACDANDNAPKNSETALHSSITASNTTSLCAYVVGESMENASRQNSLLTWLAARLPSYMLPRAVMPIPALPLTPNGKVDKKALPAPQQLFFAMQYVPPRGGLELALAELWQQILHVDRVGLTDDFFALGGDSLKAIRLVAAIEDTLGIRLDLSRLLAGATLESMSHEARSENTAPQALLPLRKGQGTALVLVNSVGGSLLCYRELVAALPPDLPIYALPPLDSTETEVSLSALAAPYVIPLAEHFPDGNFILAGLCMAGLTAWEIAAQLLQHNCPVREIVSLNTRSRLLTDDAGQPLSDQDMPTEVPAEAIDIGIHSLTGYEGQRVDSASDEQEGSAMQALRSLVKTQLLAWGHYTPPALPLTMTCVRPLLPVEQNYLPFETQPLGWQAAALAGVREFYCPGNHFSMLHAPHVHVIAQLLVEKARSYQVATKQNILSSRGSIPSPTGEANAPLTPIQRWFFDLPMKHDHFFQSVQLQADRTRPAHIYQKALEALVLRHPMLRARGVYFSKSTTTQMVIRESAEFGFRYSRFSSMETTLADIAKHFDLRRDPPLWCVLAPPTPDESDFTHQGDRLALLAHHLVVDGVSWRILQQDFSAALAYLDALAAHETCNENTLATLNIPPQSIPLPSSPLAEEGTFSQWAARLEQYAHSPALHSELPYWQNLIQTLPPPLTASSLARRHHKDLHSLTVTLEPETARPLLGRCHAAFATEGDALLLAGLADAVQHQFGRSELTVLLEGHGRQELFPDILTAATVGWFTTVHPIVLHSKTGLHDTIQSVQQSLANVPEKGIGYGILRYLAKQEELALPHADILFNFLGDATASKHSESPSSSQLLSILRLGTAHDVADDFPLEATLALTAHMDKSGLVITLNWHPQELNEMDAARFMHTLLNSLRSLVTLCLEHNFKTNLEIL